MTTDQPMEICILLDNQSNQLDSITSAAALARQMKSRLQGFFIEDDTLLRVAELPFAQEISLWSARERPMTRVGVQRTFRAYASHVRKELEKVAGQQEIDWSFQTVRGERMRWILESSSSTDILFIGGMGEAHKYRQATQGQRQTKRPLQVVFSDTKASQRALKTAIQIANQTSRPLVIMAIIDGEAEAETEMRNEIQTVLDNIPVSTPIAIAIKTAAQISTEIPQMQSHMLILPTDIALAQESEKLQELLKRIRCPVIFVR